MKKWRCTVCNYIHTGDTPPDECPVCKVGPEKFVEELPDEAPAQPPADDYGPVEDTGWMTQLILRHHLHPMSVHVPNGLIPVSALFVALAVVADLLSLAQAAFYNLVVVVCAMPIVLFTGIVEWQKKYAGAWTKPFVVKMVASAVVAIVATGLVVWHIRQPEIFNGGPTWERWIVLVLNGIMMVATGIAGFIGGKLVFKD